MSLLPLLFDESFFCPRRYHQYRHPLNDFAFGLNPRELTAILALPTELRPFENRSRDLKKKSGAQKLLPTTGRDGFQVCVDVQQFNPNEISVKTVENYVVIEGKHEEREDEHGFVSRQFTRRYALPKGYDPNSVTSTLSSDGVLTVKAPQPKALESKERVISIQHTGPAHLNVKENKIEENGEGEKNGEAAKNGEDK